ncbi:hypothetical protein [Hyunsoonleella aestuarii]|uniref:Uncharacterized protein n=1 Tax=Hyunsoonleella aestuarii TaxID=912802 RepID=A0ABP8EBD3_9FLAO|nr:hypothetical protein [Hyunsoonleella aestuarii]
MDKNFNQLKDMELLNRGLFRAGHLCILIFGILIVALGAHLKLSKTTWINLAQKLGSLVIFGATILVIYGFITELLTNNNERPLTRFSLYLILFGVSTHGLISLVPNSKNPHIDL